MQIKRFEAKNMTTALRLIKEELGLDAVILSARSLRKGKGFFGSMRYAGVEVTAAIDNQRLPMKNSNPADRKSTYPNWERARLKDAYRVGTKESIQATGSPAKIQTDRQRYHSRRTSNSRGNHKALSSLYQQLLAQEVDRSIAFAGEVDRLIEMLKISEDIFPNALEYHAAAAETIPMLYRNHEVSWNKSEKIIWLRDAPSP